MYRYYVGTFTDWYNGGQETPFAVYNADEIPASCKDLRTIQAHSQKEALAIVTACKKIDMINCIISF